MEKKILYFYPSNTAFIRRDIEMLSSKYRVKEFDLAVSSKALMPLKMIQQLFFILFNARGNSAFVCHFAGYSSFFPTVFGKLLGCRCIVIVAGTDASKFPFFGYGNYSKKLFGYFTRKSLELASLILPVHESLIYQKYNYCEWGAPEQGYTAFAPKAKKTPSKPLYYGYDNKAFKVTSGTEKKKGSFITVGNLSSPKVFIRKGNDIIIELARMRPDLNFTLLGWDGKVKFEFPPNVTLMPYMNQEDLIKVISAHEFYFQLSVMEGFPNALAEAMLCECIPIGSSVSGIPYIIGDTGYILNSRSTEELNNVVSDALNDSRRENLGRLARARIIENFTYERRLNGLVEAIEN